jgi:hypothetical protein
VNGTTTTFVMDLASGLTHALSNGTQDYIYGNGRIAQINGTDIEYFLSDALGSVRQLTDAALRKPMTLRRSEREQRRGSVRLRLHLPEMNGGG